MKLPKWYNRTMQENPNRIKERAYYPSRREWVELPQRARLRFNERVYGCYTDHYIVRLPSVPNAVSKLPFYIHPVRA